MTENTAVGQPNQRVRGGQAGAGGTAGDDHPDIRQQRGRPQQHIGRLQRLDAPDEGDDTFTGGQPQRGAGALAVPGCEGLQIDARMHDVDAARISVVQRNELVGFGFGVHDQPVGLVGNLLFADRAQRRFGGVPVGEGGVLDRGQGVRGVHQWHRPPVAGQPAHLTGEPVVRVHDVVVPRLVVGLGAQHPGGERAQLGGQVVLVQALVGPRGDVAHQYAGGERHRRRVGRGGGPGEDLDLDAAAGQVQSRLQDVDVQSARVTGSRLCQRRGVHGQHRDAARQRSGVDQIPRRPHPYIHTPPWEHRARRG